MEIITVPNPVLRQKAKEVSQFDKKFFQFLRELATTLHQQHEPEGVGLAAPQVNKSWQVFVAVIAAHGNKDVFFINPKILQKSKEVTQKLPNGEESLEGCLSIPHLYGPIPRHEWIEINYLTPNWEKKDAQGFPSLETVTEKLSGFDARVAQHEYDHLEGVLFTDYTKEKNLALYFEDKDQWVEVKNRDEILGML